MHGLLEALVKPLGSVGAARYLADSMTHVPILDLAGYVAGLARRHAIATDWSHFLDQYDVVLGPVSTQPVHSVDFDLGGPDNTDVLWHSHRLVLTVNFLGLPALAVPTGTDDRELPQSVQLIAGRYRESTCLHAGQLIEEAFGSLTPINPR
jgi:amidase